MSTPGKRTGTLRRIAVVVAVLIAVALGVWFRVAPLQHKSLWLDEVYTLRRTNHGTVAEVVSALNGSPFPPAHYVLVHAWRQVCDDPVLGVRGPSFLFGLLAVPCAFVSWRRALGDRTAGWAAVLTALSAYHVWYSVDAKMYSAVWLLTCVSHGLFVQLLVSPGPSRRGVILAYLGCTAALPFFHYAALATPAVQGIYLSGVLVLRQERRRQGTLLAGLMMLALLPFSYWLPEMLAAGKSADGLSWIGPARVERFWDNVWQIMGMLTCGFRADNHGELAIFGKAMIWLQGWAMVSGLVGFSVVLARTTGPAANGKLTDRTRVLRDVMLFLATAMIVPFLAAFVISIVGRSVWNVARYLMPVAVVAVIALAVVATQLRSRWARTIVIGPFLAVNLAMVWLDRTHQTRTPWDTVAGQIVANSPASGVTIVCDDRSDPNEAVVTLRELLRLHRERTGRADLAGADRLIGPEDWFDEEFTLLLESRRGETGRNMFRDRPRTGYRFERIGTWDVYGTSDIPNPSLVRTVTLWKMEEE